MPQLHGQTCASSTPLVVGHLILFPQLQVAWACQPLQTIHAARVGHDFALTFLHVVPLDILLIMLVFGMLT